ncbi:MAG: hypothetical protein KKH04_21400 [Proteobacteria bacterium]|nr:hypothetical protein [Pseudomonadota bacterium]
MKHKQQPPGSFVFLDQYQTEQFGLYWRHYPETGLNSGLLFNLLNHEQIQAYEHDFYPDENAKGPWSDAFQRFMSLGQVSLIHDSDRGDYTHVIMTSDILRGLNVPDFEDTFNVNYCIQLGIPFCLSHRRAADIQKILSFARQAFGTKAEDYAEPPDQGARAAIAEWLIEIEIPALSVRNESMRKKLMESGPHLVAKRGDGKVDQDFTNLLLASKWYELRQSTFLSPEELVMLLEDTEVLRVLRSRISSFSKGVSSKAHLADSVKMEHDELNAKIGNTDLVFAGINIGFCWVPFSSLGTTPAQKGINYYIKKHYNWLIFLNSLNKSIRERTKTELDAMGGEQDRPTT